MYRILILPRKNSAPYVKNYYNTYEDAVKNFKSYVRMRVQFIALFEDEYDKDLKLLMFNNLRGTQYVNNSENNKR